MGKYDYKDPGLDHDYCDALTPEPTEEPEPRVCSYCGILMPYSWAEDYCSMFCLIDAEREENGE